MSEPYRGPCWQPGIPDPLASGTPADGERAKREFEAAQKAKPRWVGKPKPKKRAK